MMDMKLTDQSVGVGHKIAEHKNDGPIDKA